MKPEIIIMIPLFLLFLSISAYVTYEEAKRDYVNEWVKTECPPLQSGYRYIDEPIKCEWHNIHTRGDKISTIIGTWITIGFIAPILVIIASKLLIGDPAEL